MIKFFSLDSQSNLFIIHEIFNILKIIGYI